MTADHELAIEAILGVRKHIQVGLFGEVEGWKPSSKTGGACRSWRGQGQENGPIKWCNQDSGSTWVATGSNPSERRSWILLSEIRIWSRIFQQILTVNQDQEWSSSLQPFMWMLELSVEAWVWAATSQVEWIAVTNIRRAGKGGRWKLEGWWYH